jgi:hypothetical protein
MLEFHNPVKAITNTLGFGGGGGGTTIVQASPGQDTQNEAAAREEAARKARAAAASRAGQRSTLLTANPSGTLGGVNTTRRTLLGG